MQADPSEFCNKITMWKFPFPTLAWLLGEKLIRNFRFLLFPLRKWDDCCFYRAHIPLTWKLFMRWSVRMGRLVNIDWIIQTFPMIAVGMYPRIQFGQGGPPYPPPNLEYARKYNDFFFTRPSLKCAARVSKLSQTHTDLRQLKVSSRIISSDLQWKNFTWSMGRGWIF